MNRQVDKKILNQTTKQVRIDVWWHQYIKLIAADRRMSVKHIIEECLGDYYCLDDYLQVKEKIN